MKTRIEHKHLAALGFDRLMGGMWTIHLHLPILVPWKQPILHFRVERYSECGGIVAYVHTWVNDANPCRRRERNYPVRRFETMEQLRDYMHKLIGRVR